MAWIGDLPASRLDDLLPNCWKRLEVPSTRLAMEQARRREARRASAVA